jgi:hypothetical protein
MYDPDPASLPEVDPVTGLPTGTDTWAETAALADLAEPTEEQLAFLAALDAHDLADLNALESGTGALPEVWQVSEDLARRARVAEVLTRKAQAVGLRETRALFEQVLADDAAYVGGMRAKAGEFAADEIAAALGITRRSAQFRIDDALDLLERPTTLALLDAGVLAYPAARALAREAGRASRAARRGGGPGAGRPGRGRPTRTGDHDR